MALPPTLLDLKNVINSQALGAEVTCKDLDDALIITDVSIVEFTTLAETINTNLDGIGIRIVLPIGPAINKADRSYPQFHSQLIDLCEHYSLIPFREVRRDQAGNLWAKHGFAVRFSWTIDSTQLAETLDHNMTILRRFYSEEEAKLLQNYQTYELDTVDDDTFEQMTYVPNPDN